MFRPYVPYEECLAALGAVLRTRWIGEGPQVKVFERAFRQQFNVPYAVSVNSGTSALDTAYDLLDLQAGDEVITTPLTCTATNLPLIRRGVKLVWADILPTTLCIDPEDVRRKLTPKTKAVVQVHLGGIRAEVEDVGVPVVSDACQALGIFVGHYPAGSFQAIKHFTTGDGGMLVCTDPKAAHKARLLRWFGIDREKKVNSGWQSYKDRKMTFQIELPGTKRQMTDLDAALGLVGLAHYDRILAHRKTLFDRYRERLTGVEGMTLVDGSRNTYWLCTLLVERREGLVQKLFEADVDTNLVQLRNDIQPIFGHKRQDLPVMNAVESKYLSVPLGMHVSLDDVDYICDTIRAGW